ncbi:MAG: NAD(P)H dehydrogenase [Saprospiraceae bacterium]|nr:MAG: NAD(P)H dehydrogenase [Saprospiraceae bacterium]
MKYLIIYAHPNQDSLNSYFKQSIYEFIQSTGHEVEIRDLYQLNFNPVLSLEDMHGQRKGEVAADVKIEQNFINWADCLIVIHPIWWTGLPAIMKGYIDRVFSYGFAYRYDNGVQKGLLKEKQVIIINTQGKSQSEYQEIEMDKALTLTSDKGIYLYSGLEIKRHFYFDKADRTTEETVVKWINQVETIFYQKK